MLAILGGLAAAFAWATAASFRPVDRLTLCMTWMHNVRSSPPATAPRRILLAYRALFAKKRSLPADPVRERHAARRRRSGPGPTPRSARPLILHERVARHQVAGVAALVAGVAVLSLPQA